MATQLSLTGIEGAKIMRRYSFVIAGIVALSASPASASCKVTQLIELPVTIRDDWALVNARFGTREVQLIVDSGASTSALTPATARDLQLKTEPAAFLMRGTGGLASASLARTNDFALGGVVLPGMTFVVGGADYGTAGLLGQDILGIADVDYDLPHGLVRLMRSDGCNNGTLSSSTGLNAAAVLPIEKAAVDGPYRPVAIVPVNVDGVTLRAKLDTGSFKTTMTLAAAKRLGVTSNSPGVVETGYAVGIGGQHNPVWRASFQRMQIGREITDKPLIYIQDITQGVDMLLGFDFFIRHRVYVANQQHKAYLKVVEGK